MEVGRDLDHGGGGSGLTLEQAVDDVYREPASRQRGQDQYTSEDRLHHGLESSLLSVGNRLIVKATAGLDAPERCSQAFTLAATAISSGTDVSLWLTGESAWFALPGRAAEFELPHAAPLPDLLAAVLAGGQVTLCTQCAARREIGPDDVLPGIRIAGAATFVEEALADGAQALVY
jgi:predicted peroxiredoxin